MDLDKIWSEKYRPQKIQDLVLCDNDKKIIENFIKNDEIPNLLFYGNAGTGKTTTGKILISALDAEDLFLNCAEVGIDDVRSTISNFSKTKSFNGKKKIVDFVLYDRIFVEISGFAYKSWQDSFINSMKLLIKQKR